MLSSLFGFIYTPSDSIPIGLIQLPQLPSVHRWLFHLCTDVRVCLFLLWRYRARRRCSWRICPAIQERPSSDQSDFFQDRHVLHSDHLDYRSLHQLSGSDFAHSVLWCVFLSDGSHKHVWNIVCRFRCHRLSPHCRLRQSRVRRCRPRHQRRTFDGSVIGYQLLLLCQLAHVTFASERRTRSPYLWMGEQ